MGCGCMGCVERDGAIRFVAVERDGAAAIRGFEIGFYTCALSAREACERSAGADAGRESAPLAWTRNGAEWIAPGGWSVLPC